MPHIDCRRAELRDLSIIIVNWKSADYLDRCLQTITGQPQGLDLEIVVVDNASFDGSEELIRTKFPRVNYVQSYENLGFARANNLGFERSTGKTLLFLNPDTEILGGAIRTLWTALETLPDAGAVNSRMLNSDRSLQPDSVHRFPTLFNQMWDVNPRRFLPSRFTAASAKNGRSGEIREVDAVSGACVMIRREVFEKIGRWSSEYFMYSEDLDLCFKIRRAGFKIYQIQSAAIVHHGGGSSRKQENEYRSVLLMKASIYEFLKKFKGSKYARCYKMSMAPISTGRLILTLLAYPAAVLLGKAGAVGPVMTKWGKILAWSLGLEEERAN